MLNRHFNKEIQARNVHCAIINLKIPLCYQALDGYSVIIASQHILNNINDAQ